MWHGYWTSDTARVLSHPGQCGEGHIPPRTVRRGPYSPGTGSGRALYTTRTTLQYARWDLPLPLLLTLGTLADLLLHRMAASAPRTVPVTVSWALLLGPMMGEGPFGTQVRQSLFSSDSQFCSSFPDELENLG